MARDDRWETPDRIQKELGDIERGREKGGEHAAQTPGSAANLAVYMKGIHFPVNKKDLLRHVEQNGAPDEVRNAVQHMPDQEFASVVAIMKAFSQEKREEKKA